MVDLKRFRQTNPSFADLLPYAALVANGILLLKDGSLLAGWYYAGPDSESATNLERNEISRQINQVLARLGSGWMIQVESIRIPTNHYPDREASHFPDEISALIDEERRTHFEAQDGHFESQHAILLTYKPVEAKAHKASSYLYSDQASRKQSHADKILEAFQKAITEFEQYLSNILTIRRMRTIEAEEGSSSPVRYDELLQFIRFCLVGKNHPIRLPSIPSYLDHVMTAEFHHGLSPLVDGRYLAIVGIDAFPSESWPGILNALDQMPLSYRWSSRFIFLDEQEARQKLERTRKKWIQKVRPFLDQLFQTQSGSIDQDAALMVAETEDAISEASSQLVAYGYYTPVIVLFDDNPDQLQEKAQWVRRFIQAEGFGARIETLNCTDAYLGSLPGLSYANVREPLIHSRNLADLVPLNSIWAGVPEAPCPFYPTNSPPLSLVACGSTPFRFNLHVDDLGHSLIFGPTGSGKSTLLGLIAAQFRRYQNAQIFAFDKGLSLFPLTLSVNGKHYEIGEDKALSFCPLQDLESEGDKAWANEWLETLLSLQGLTITPEHRLSISRQIELMSQSKRRSLSDFVSGVQARDIKTALEPYCIHGAMGHLLDAEEYSLTLSSFQTFEMEELMALGERTLIPVLLYLFRRIEKRLTGNPSLIILDEAWIMLGHPVFRDKIREWLKVLRKANCAIVLATQSISDADQSGIMDVLKESCPTKICLPNGAARDPGTRHFYEQLGFNDRQIEIISEAIPKRDYYITSPDGRRLFDMALGPITLSFIGASGKDDLEQIKALIKQYGKGWPEHWLNIRGIADHGLSSE